MKVRFWGVRGSISVADKQTIQYGGNTTCLEVLLDNGQLIIIDAGSGIYHLGRQLIAQKPKVKEIHLFITHVHWDHILGFPFFMPVYQDGRTIHIYGPKKVQNALRNVFAKADGFFPVDYDELKATIVFHDLDSTGTVQFGETMIDTIPLLHPQGGLGYRFQADGKKMVFLTDNELNMIKNAASREYQKYVKFCQNADLLIHDAQYLPEEMAYFSGFGHSDYQTVCDLAISSQVKQLLLFHHDPSRTDVMIPEIVKKCEAYIQSQSQQLLVDAAKEEMEIVIK